MTVLAKPRSGAAKAHLLTEEALARLQSRVELFTRFAGGATDASVRTDVVLLAPPGAALPAAFEHAHRLLREGKTVRLIGHGVTLDGLWPAWVASAPSSLLLTELGAYALATRVSKWSLARTEAINQWLRACFADVFEDLLPEKILSAWTVNRIVGGDFDPALHIAAVLAMNPGARIEITDERWSGTSALREAESAGTAAAPRTRDKVRFGAKVVAGVAAAWPVAASRIVREYVGARPGLAELRARRAAGTEGRAAQWVGLMPSWPRMSAHLITHVRQRTPKDLGILMFGSLRPIVREEQALASRAATLFAGLADLESELERAPLDQVSGPETVRGIGWVLARSALGTARATAAVVKQGPMLPLVEGAGPLELTGHVGAVIRLLSLDIMEALAGDIGARTVASRRSFDGVPIIFATGSPPAVAAASWRLASHGATVVECHHGFSGGSFTGAGPFRCFWTHPEVDDRAPIGERAVIAATPPHHSRPRTAPRGPERVLLLTGYAHRDSLTNMPTTPFHVFQDEVLRVAELLPAAEATFRWRPHPADLDALVEPAIQRYPQLDVSRGARSLAADIDWADVVVSNLSTCVVEAELTGAPVFVHLLPELQQLALTDFVAPERAFFRAEELADKLRTHLTAWRAGDPHAMEPERRARVMLFGPTGEPADIFATVQALARSGHKVGREVAVQDARSQKLSL